MAYDLTSEINAKLDSLAEQKLEWDARWIAHAICEEHKPALDDDDEHSFFWLHCGYDKCREEVRRAINKRADDKPEVESRQYILPGYDHVHLYYVVRRDGVDVGVPVDCMTDAEIEGKADLYREMGKACLSHANELLRFKRERKAAA